MEGGQEEVLGRWREGEESSSRNHYSITAPPCLTPHPVKAVGHYISVSSNQSYALSKSNPFPPTHPSALLPSLPPSLNPFNRITKQDVNVSPDIGARMQPILDDFTATHKVPGSIVLMAR